MGLSRLVAPSPRRTRVLWVLLALVACAAALDALHLVRLARWNEQIDASRAVAASTPTLAPALQPAASAASAAADPLDAPDAPAPARFAAAHALAARGADEAALQRYRALQDDSPLGRAARYNSANLLMRQAVVLRAGPQPGQAIALIELAKEMYRDVLRADPTDWPARYNLERAQRLLPEPDDADFGPIETNRSAERAATTMRGYSPGLP